MAVSTLTSSVLVLNKYYMAVHVTNVKRAFGLLFKELAEVVTFEDDNYATYNFDSWVEVSQLRREFEANEGANGHEYVRTVRYAICVPRIIRLLFYDRLPQRSVKLNRRNIFARDENSCQYCGKRFSTSELTLDHIVPRSQGGESSWKNLVCACVDCNVRKGGRLPREARMRLIRPPIKPRRSPVLHLKLRSPKYQSWKTFLDTAYWEVELK